MRPQEAGHQQSPPIPISGSYCVNGRKTNLIKMFLTAFDKFLNLDRAFPRSPLGFGKSIFDVQ
jgi:hypothetical protein